jgi:SAM-dependent methyltransferase
MTFKKYLMSWRYFYSVLRRPSSISSMPLLRFFNNKSGVVIGGRLRWNFQALASTAQKIINVDNCPSNLSKPDDVDYVTDATNLFFAADETLDFVCSSHVLEHIANPLKAITEWKRVIKKGAIIYAGVPDKRYMFDRKRPRTPLSHLIDDFEKNIDQNDKTHISEFLEKFDESITYRDSIEQHRADLMKNLESHVHHHVWIADDVEEIFEHMGLRILYGPVLHHGTIHIMAQKP